MRIRGLVATALVALLTAPVIATPPTTVPRKSPDFTIYEGSGKATQLSSFQGKVVVIEFFFMRSPKCLRLAQTMNKLHAELGPRGFQPIAIAFGNDATGPAVAYMEQYFKLTYPVGYTSAADVDAYLGRTGNEVFNIPQVIVIDRAGLIRAQSGGKGGDPDLENEDSLRALLNSLLNEDAAHPRSKVVPPSTKKPHH